jgi:hypothetical protein
VSLADPGACNGDTSGYTLQPHCTCRHLPEVHTPRPRDPRVRGACTAHTPDACPCRTYRPDTTEDTR